MKELVELTPSEMEIVSGGVRDISIILEREREREVKVTLVLIRNNGNTTNPPPV